VISVDHSRHLLIRAVISIGLIAWLLSSVDLGQIANQWQRINWLLLALVIPPIHLVCIGLRALRLKMILRGMGLGISAWWLGLAHLKSVFVGTLLPGGISGDLYRTYLVSKTTGQGCESIAAICIEKLVGIVSMLFMSLGGLFWGAYLMSEPGLIQLERSLRFVWGGLLAGGVLFGAIAYTGQLEKIQLPFQFWPKLSGFLRQILGFFAKSKHLFEMIVVSLLIQVAVVAWYFAISAAVHFNTSFLILMLTVPIIEFLLMLPISVSGIGVREVAFVVLLTPFGLTAADAVSFSLLTFTVGTVAKVLSGAAFLLTSSKEGTSMNTSSKRKIDDIYSTD
jgi:glycosyltransferase 2 family protein